MDAVVIASATDTHFPYIMQALRADKAVLAEKPISHELHEVEEAVELAKTKNLAFVCGYQRRADRHFRELKRQLDAGAIGNLKLLKTCSRDNPIPPMEYLRTSGGIFHDMLIHDFDMLDFLSGGQVPESVTATGHSYHPEIEAMGDVDVCAVMFKYASGLIAMVDTSRDASYGYDQRIEAFGESGMLTAKNELTSTIELATADGHLMPPAMYSFPQRYHQAGLEHGFAQCFGTDSPWSAGRRMSHQKSYSIIWIIYIYIYNLQLFIYHVIIHAIYVVSP